VVTRWTWSVYLLYTRFG